MQIKGCVQIVLGTLGGGSNWIHGDPSWSKNGVYFEYGGSQLHNPEVFFQVIRLCSHRLTFTLMTWKISSIFSTVIARIWNDQIATTSRFVDYAEDPNSEATPRHLRHGCIDRESQWSQSAWWQSACTSSNCSRIFCRTQQPIYKLRLQPTCRPRIDRINLASSTSSSRRWMLKGRWGGGAESMRSPLPAPASCPALADSILSL